ncbi:MAG: cobalamin biosynthesis protein CbiX [Betaproteobacteria bacterium]|nr:cobalamin biosynthesis protein CbiX [Betaproteobacteria bacterium]
MKTAVILFAHGARDPEWALPMRRVQALVREQSAGVDIELAFLEFTAPTLGECVGELVARGAGRIVVLPMFIARGGHLKREVPEMIAALRLTYPETDISLAAVIGEQDAVVRAMAAAAVEVAGL